jgi:hypothetical protein
MKRVVAPACAIALGCIAFSTSAPASTCVDPTSDALRRASCDPKRDKGCDAVVVRTVDDLDGDGARDVLVAQQTMCGATGNCSYAVYLTGNHCAHYAGDVGGVLVAPTQARHFGVRDLAGYWKGGCAASEGVGYTWAFDGTAYHVADSYTCACLMDGPVPASRDKRCPRP